MIKKLEIVNAYQELNDPDEQLARFNQQQKDKTSGDQESQAVNEEFVEALNYGLPPTAGWGMGIDRLVMLMTRAASIKDVISFPFIKPERPSEKALEDLKFEEKPKAQD